MSDRHRHLIQEPPFFNIDTYLNFADSLGVDLMESTPEDIVARVQAMILDHPQQTILARAAIIKGVSNKDLDYNISQFWKHNPNYGETGKRVKTIAGHFVTLKQLSIV